MLIKAKDKKETEFVEAFLQDMEDDPYMMNSYLFGDNDVSIEVADGCQTAHDGICPHGYTSPLRLLGII